MAPTHAVRLPLPTGAYLAQCPRRDLNPLERSPGAPPLLTPGARDSRASGRVSGGPGACAARRTY
jgi:hypothetical protein